MSVKTYGRNNANDLGHTQNLQNSGNVDESAVDVVGVNSLVPRRFAKVALTHTTLPNSKRAISRAVYYGRGAKPIYRVRTRGSINGATEKTILDAPNISPLSLEAKYFVIYDSVGSVGVWYRYNPATIAPAMVVDRSIMVDIQGQSTIIGVLTATVNKLEADSEFSAYFDAGRAIIELNASGDEPNGNSGTTPFTLTIINGLDPIHNTYFYLYNGNNVQKYHAWYNVDGTGFDPDPDPGNSLPIEINITSFDTIAEISSKSAFAISNITGFDCIANLDSFEIVVDQYGVNTPVGGGTTNHYAYDIIQSGKDHEIVADLQLTYDLASELVEVENLF